MAGFSSAGLPFNRRDPLLHGRADFPAASGPPSAAVERSAIPDRYKWDLERIFPDWSAWEAGFDEVEKRLPELAARQGSLGRSAQDLLATIETIHAVQRILELVLVFAGMKSDEDTRDGENTARRGRSSSLAIKFSEATSWFEAELLEIEPATIAEFLATESRLELYRHFFDDIQRARDHTLDADQEALLAATAIMARGASNVFNALNNADLTFPDITDEDGNRVELTKARYYKYLRSKDRRVREEAFVTCLDTYGTVKNTLAANLDANVKNHVFNAQVRSFPGTLEAALHRNAIPPEVFHALIETVGDNLETVHRYTALKRRVLELDPLREYDLYVPLFADAEFTYSYDDATELLLEALAPLGPNYLDIVREGYSDGWIDVHENVGKRSGAYSNGVYDSSPYILLNWSDQLGDTFTLAHEMGHSVHTYLAARNQPYVYGDYPIFTAEVASTCNEMLLMHYLLENTEDKRRRLYLLDYYLTQINSTVFRQTMFADFEYRIHLLGEKGDTLTADSLGSLYVDMLNKYWGDGVEFDGEPNRVTWARIPHFYYNYYVYQYATAYSAAAALVKRMLAGDNEDRERYLGVLRSGNSRYPVETLQIGGVDMTTDKPVKDVVSLFDTLLDTVEQLLEETE